MDSTAVNLNEMVNGSLSKIVSEKLPQMIEKHLSEAVNSVISDAFSYSSEIRRQIKLAVSSKMCLNFDDITIPEYNKMITATINEALCKVAHFEGLEKLKKDTEEMLTKSIPAEIKISELVREFATDDSAGEERSENIMFIHELHSGDFHYYYMDKDDSSSRYDCAICITTYQGKICSAKIDGFDPSKQVKIGSFFGFKEKVFRMYAAGTIIIPDVENVETEYCYDED